MTTPLDAVSELVDLGEDAIPESGICIVAFMRPDGQRAYKWAVLGDKLELGTALGMLSVVSHEFYYITTGQE